MPRLLGFPVSESCPLTRLKWRAPRGEVGGVGEALGVTHSPADERTIHRYEAFSDIVIGFALAELGSILILPRNGAGLFADPSWLIAFLLAFSAMCALWFFHHRMFESVFVPRTIPIILNFTWLAVVVLCAYSTQLIVRVGDVEVWRLYYTLFLLAYGLLALQYYVCVPLLAGKMSPELSEKTRRQTAFMTLWTVPFLACTIMVFTLPIGETQLPTGVVFTATAVVSGFLGRYYRKREKAPRAPEPSSAG